MLYASDFVAARIPQGVKGRSYLLLEKGEYEAALDDADACKLSKKHKVLPLAALFGLGRIDEIYERLAIHSKADPENISLAASQPLYLK